MEWLDEQDYSIMSWPLYSPDLNPIEIVWYMMKVWVHNHYPKLRTIKLGPERVKTAIETAVKEAWKAVREGYLKKLLESMPH